MLLSRFQKGINDYFPAYAIQEDEFSNLINATVSRGVVSKKLGSEFLGQLQRTYSPGVVGETDSSGNFSGTFVPSPFVGIAPETFTLIIGSTTYSDNGSGVIVNGTTTVGSLNYAIGYFSITGQSALTNVTLSYGYFPGLPVMGIGTLQSVSYATIFSLVVMDTTYAYSFNYGTRAFFDISYYSMTAPQNPVTWNGSSTQQFDFQNFQDVLFLTNNQSGMAYKLITNITIVSSGTTSAVLQVTIPAHGLVANDKIFFYEVQGMTAVNGLTGLVLSTSLTTNSFQASITYASGTVLNPYTLGGLAQYLTSSAAGISGIRYYDGSGFVNFAPPLASSSITSTGGTIEYIAGCRLLIVFGNRLIALGPTLINSGGTTRTLSNALYFSAINSALYTEQQSAWWVTPVGTGGFLILGGNQNIVSAEISYEQLILGLAFSYRKVITTGSTILPFVDYVISDVYGSICPFASVLLDNAVLGITNIGITLATTNDVRRIDALNIPDATQEISRYNNGLLQVCAIRDYFQQLIYFTYPQTGFSFPNKTIVYNYLESNWSYHYETFTCYGNYLEQGSSRTWATAGTWADAGTWGDTSGDNFTIQVAGGTPTGAVNVKANATYNEPFMIITAISGNQLTIPNHNLAVSSYIFIDNCLGVTNLNGLSVQVTGIVDGNNVTVSTAGTGTYLGLGTCAMSDNFLIQFKQLNPNWQKGLGSEVASFIVLLQNTDAGQISATFNTNFIDFSYGSNSGDTNPVPSTINTCPDANLGLTGQQTQQQSIWHKLPVLVSGQTIQLNLYLSSQQMANTNYCQSPVVMQSVLIDLRSSGEILP